MLKKLFTSIILCILVIVGVCGCVSSNSTASVLLSKSQESCFKQEQLRLSKIHEAYNMARNKNNISHKIDSLLVSITGDKKQDTIYILEDCNPPLYSYNAIIWNKKHAFTLFGSGLLINNILDDDMALMKLLESWEIGNIMLASHEKPLIYSGEWNESRIVSRIIMNESKCVNVESVIFSAIDMDNKSTPVFFE